ncbi:MAG: Ig domain-containing protein, partial [Nanobdellota archaeon]
MIKKMKTILLTLAVFLMILAPAHASVNVETVELTPNNPKTSANLACNYTVTASNGEVLEQVNLTWYNGSETHAETPLPLTDNTNQTSGTRTLISTNTRKGENWKCEVHALGNASNESTTDSSTVIYNTIPVMSNIGNKEVNVDKSLSFTVNTQDADATDGTDELTYELNNAPVGMEIDGNRITWRPDMEQKGTHEVDVIVTDNEGANDMASFSVEVYQMMLAVEDLDVDCSPSCDDNLDEEDGGSIEEVRPGSTMELEINLENLWDEDVDDHDIEDIEIIGTLEDMGDEDEQEEEEEIGKLDPEEEDSVTLKFDIPEETDEDTYD